MTGTLTITLTDVNDEVPVCTVKTFSETVSEGITVPTSSSPYTVSNLGCSDADAVDATLSYSITSGDTSKFKVSAAGVLQVINTS